MHRRPTDDEIAASASASDPKASLSEVRRKAVSMREHGWRWEMQGRAFAYREAAQQVKRWLLDGALDRSRVEFLIELLENSAEVYDSADDEIVRD